MTDVVVIGGGPGGSVCATKLVQLGLSVIVLEKAKFPRFHLGESLLPQTMLVLKDIGIYDKVAATFMPKYGARFHDDINQATERFEFSGAWKPINFAFQVQRGEFDKMLLDFAREKGADVREEWSVEKIVKDASGRACGVEAVDPQGNMHTLEARFVVDATGRDAFTAHETKNTSKIDGLDQTALFAHFENVKRQEGQLAGDIDIVLFPATEKHRPNWFWFIPFKDGHTSVGAVVSKGWMMDKKKQLPEGVDVISALFDEAVRASPSATKLLEGATCTWSKKEAAADFSYRTASMRGDGYLRVGDAGGFIDPLFSTGVHVAVSGGKLGAEAIVKALANPAEEQTIFAEWEATVRKAAETFIMAVLLFYKGPLVPMLFAPDKHTALRRSITSLLAGDVFHDGIWLRDTRNRFREILDKTEAQPAAE